MSGKSNAIGVGVVILFLLLGWTVPAATIQVQSGSENAVTVLSDAKVTLTAAGEAAFIGDPDIQYLGETGEPRIPWKIITVLLKPNADLTSVSCNLVSVNSTPVDGVWNVSPIPPMATRDLQGNEQIVWPAGKQIVNGCDAGIYNTNAFWPYEQVKIVQTGFLRKWKLVEIAVPLISYNPVTCQLYELSDAEVQVNYASRGKIGSGDRQGKERVKDIAVNFKEASKDYDAGSQSATSPAPAAEGPAPAGLSSTGYAVITTSAIQNASTKLASFISHKQSQGFTVHVITESQWGGGSGPTAATNLAAWLQNNYISKDLLYVLLIGNPHPDSGDVPMMWVSENLHGATPTDYYYSDLTGNDRYWEVLTGRIPYYGSDSELDSILQKTMDYENSASTDWRRDVLLPMVPVDGSTPCYQVGEEIQNNLLLPQSITSYRIYEKAYNLNPAPENLLASCWPASQWASDAYGMVVWMTHGWQEGAVSVIDNSNVPSLNNAFPAVTWQGACQNAWPEYTTNIAYKLLVNGAIATHGATRNSWYWPGETTFTNTSSNGGFAYQFASRIVQQKSCGQSLAETRQYLVPGIWDNFILFNTYGDPSVVVMKSPTDITISPTDTFDSVKVKNMDPNPYSRNYTLKNNRPSSINWTAAKTVPWLTISPASGSLAAGATATLTVSFNSNVSSLTNIGTYTDTVTFTDTTNNVSAYRPVRLEIKPPLLAHWKLNEYRDAWAADSSGRALHGTLSNMTDSDWVTGVYGRALDFDGSDDYVTVPSLDLANNVLTVTAWVKPSGTQSWDGIFYCRPDGNACGFTFGNGNELRYCWNGASNTWEWNSGLVAPAGQWSFVCLVVEPAKATIYMDSGSGLQSAVNTVSHGIQTIREAFSLGRDPAYSRYYSGAMDDIRVYSYPLSTAEISVVRNDPGTDVFVENYSFELPGTTKQTTWTSVHGWSSDAGAPNSGVESDWIGHTDGLWTAFLYDADPSVWQLTNHTIASNQTFTLKVDGRHNWASGSSTSGLKVTLYYDNSGTRTFAAAQSFTLPASWSTYTVSFSSNSVPASIGKRIGIEFENTAGGGWLALDNVRLECQTAQDITPPAAPTGLAATAGNTSVSLDWADNTESDLASYKVKRATVSGGPYTTIAAGLTTSAYTDNTVTNGTTYYYVVSAVDSSSNESANSSQASATPQAPAAATLLQDGFETDFNKWTDGGTTDWDRNTSQKHAGSYSAHAGSTDNDLISDNLNTTGYSSITLEFWYRDDDIDDGDDIYLQLYNGSSYANKFELGNSAEDTWHFYTVTINNSGTDTQYFRSNFRIKFEGTSIDSGENLWIDDVKITVQ